jgi:hypothetical protein
MLDNPASPPVADPLEPLLAEAVALAAAYDRVVATQSGLAGRLRPLADDHRAHAAQLAQLIDRPVPPTPASASAPALGSATSGSATSGSATSGSAAAASSAAAAGSSAAIAHSLVQLGAAEQIAQRNAVSACRRAPADRAALIGSIAACRATHVEALR